MINHSYHLFIYLENMDFKERLIATVKKEVKQVMEEAVTRKYIHEESGSVTSLCAGQLNYELLNVDRSLSVSYLQLLKHVYARVSVAEH